MICGMDMVNRFCDGKDELNMAEYIERDEAIRKAISACIKIVGHGITQIDAVDIADEIDGIPATDMVEVVRCKDCMFSETVKSIIDGGTMRVCRYGLYRQSAPDMHFCSHGHKDGRKG